MNHLESILPAHGRRICVAPMLDWTDRHCRFFHRQFSRHAWLYTEMVTTGALLHGDVARHLAFNEAEHPVALQLGGSEPAELARAARLAADWGYDEVNLNCGCPSERVQRGAFGACLMAEPGLVADGVKAMRDAVTLPVTVKHRIGIDHGEDYGFVRDFVGVVAAAGCATFIVHARNAILKGLSPKQNREIPPLRYEYAYRLKRDFPDLEIIVNGGIQTLDQAAEHLQRVDGVMLGREAYQNPTILRGVDQRFYGSTAPAMNDAEIEAVLIAYCEDAHRRGTPLNAIVRHVLGWHRGAPGARNWRRILSDTPRLTRGDFTLFDDARAALRTMQANFTTFGEHAESSSQV
ncbi:tRNA dihydrouridine(20/20a) synthase DusA [Robbsia sp. Bb-Pol-6]|uniref:tRNA-dihydrouridine(20/20a) synthase n=1 Tax=Robbsia betulipollinis TaxID=2981849 RepID=A0ABT3ZNB7_9BURK|nr:tRNA dihydrouridine(20/20a) synthase DusA [Robbsia betulipollinis]MCY0388006.1 tRNA dihydrouridine(20/20a) synthase DusA [Robbsia betulipollinis]